VKFVENRLSVSRQCLQGHYRETGFKFALPLGQFISESNPSYFPVLRATLGKRASLTSPNNRKLEKKKVKILQIRLQYQTN